MMPLNRLGSAIWPTILTLVAGLILALTIYTSYVDLGPSLGISQQCRMSRMWPSYVLHTPPSPSGLGSKYRLYLYRENSPSRSDPLESLSNNSRPTVFVPGNAGSYGQVRSVASWSWIQYQAQLQASKQFSSSSEAAVQELDWWTIDYNEDFSAFHAQTILDEAIYLNEVLAYIQGIYSHSTVDEIPILAHSMGGIVSRLALLQSNHPQQKDPTSPLVKTIVTLSTPHVIPPAPIEKGLQDIYDLINVQVHNGLSPLIISLSGGLLDTQLPSEYALLPSAMHFFTTDIPSLWSSVDHLAMMWCDQLRRKVLQGFAMATSTKKMTLQERKCTWNRALGNPDASDPQQYALLTRDLPTVDIPTADLASTSQYPLPDVATFNLVTSCPPGQPSSFDVLTCSQSSSNTSHCSPIPQWAFAMLPASSTSGASHQAWKEFPSAETEYHESRPNTVLRELRLNADTLRQQGWTTIHVVHHSDNTQCWFKAGWSSGQIELNKGDSNEFLARSKANTSPVQVYTLPQIRSSIIKYALTIRSKCLQKDTQGMAFSPMIHARSHTSGDGRWYPSLSSLNDDSIELPINLHTTSPYLDGNEAKEGISLTVYTDPDVCPSGVDSVQNRPQVLDSLGLMVSRFRLGVAVWPLALWGVVMSFQDFGSSSVHHVLIATASNSRLIVGILLSAVILPLVQLILPSKYSQHALMGMTSQSLRAFGWQYGDEMLTFWFILVSYTLSGLLWWIVVACLIAITSALSWLAKTIKPLGNSLRFDNDTTSPDASPKFKPSTLLTLLLTILLVKFLIPYQFIFLSLTLQQLLNVVRSHISQSSTTAFKRANQNTLILTHLFLLLPLRVPTLVVFIRNFIAGYNNSASSTLSHLQASSIDMQLSEDHSILKILPVLLLVQILSSGRILESPTATVPLKAVYLVVALYGIFYGIRFPYRLYDISLVMFTLLVVGHYLVRWKVIPTQRPSDDSWQRRVSATVVEVEEESLLKRGEERETRFRINDEDVIHFDIPDQFLDHQHVQTEQGKGNAKSNEESQDASSTTPADGDHQSKKDKTLNALLTDYLKTLHTYTTLQTSLSETLSGSYFALSTDRMASGGWGSNMRRDISDAKLKREIEVDVGQKWEIREVELPYVLEDGEEENEMKSGNETTATEDKEERYQGLRRRKGKEDDKAASSIQDDKTDSQSPSSSSPSPSPSPRRRHPSAIQQYSALPSANLRKSQKGFKSALQLIVSGQSQGAASGGLVSLRNRLLELEEEIRVARKRQTKTSDAE
ncbi:unnamed protein product [Sympodiomycopsis kandeliae]